MNLLGVFSSDNNDPMMHLLDHTAINSYLVIERSDTELVFGRRSSQATSEPTYFGGICAPDGSEIYWQNDSKPLP